MAESSNVERNPYLTPGNPAGMMVEESEIEIILPEEEESPVDMIMEMVEEMTYDHNENLVDKLEASELDDIASKVIEGFEADKESRGEWEATFEKGFDLLGLKLRETSEPFEGACTAVHPLLIESAVKFQSKATQELFPSKGPVKTQILGNPTIEKDRQATRVMNFMNYQLTDQMPEYFSELERMLFNLPVFGSAFKKTYWDMALERPMSEFVPIDQFYISNFASDLQNAERYTHVVYRSPNDLKRDIEAGMYTISHYDDEGLPDATPVEPTPIKSKMDMILGISPNYDDEPQYTILEQHCYLEIEEEVDDEDNAMTVALPYIVSVDEHSRKILCIRRNWSESDPRKEKLHWFTHYRFVPGFGFYGLGFIHFLGNLTATATAAVRNLVDAGQFATLPGGFKARGVRIVGSNDAIAPGEFKEVEATGIDLTKSIIPLPYKEPSQTLMQMLQFVTAAGQKFADATEQVISDSTNYGPVGTTLALLEASTKFFSAIHKRLHYSQRQELRILSRINYDFLPNEYPYDIAHIEGQIFKSDFDGRIDVIPVSDPNVPSASHRLAMAQTVMQMAQQAPQGMYNLREINRVMLDATGIENPDQFLIPEKHAEPRDPISDLNAAAQGLPIKAFPGQDHQAHITVKQSFIADPTLGQNPLMQALVPVLQANIREHMIMQYEEQMSGMLTQGVEQAGVGSPEAISKITQGAAQEILQNNQRMAEQGNVQDLERMTLELQRQQLELEKEKVKIDAAQKAADIALQEEKLDLEKDKIEVDAAEKLAKIKGVARDREIVASSKTADRDDKFLIEMMKLLMKETGATVEKLKEEVTLRPETFNQGGTVFGMIGDYANQLGVSIMDVLNQLGSYFEAPEPSTSDSNMPSPLGLTPPQRPTDLGRTTRATTEDYIDTEDYVSGVRTLDPMEGYVAPTIGEVQVEELESIGPKRTGRLTSGINLGEDITDRFGAELRARSTPEAAQAWKKEHDAFLASLKGTPKVEEDISTELISQITDAPPSIESAATPAPAAPPAPPVPSKGVPSLPSPGMPQEPRGASSLASILGILEGTKYHKDQKKIKTAPYGVVIDPKRTAAYKRNKKVSDKLGYDLQNLTQSQALVVASEVADDVSADLGREVGAKYNKLSPKSQALIIDAKFNTGTTYGKLVNALTKYEKAPSNETLKDVIAESRRTVKKDGVTKTSVGQDNRVAKLIFSLGFLSPTKENVDFINKSFNVPGKAKWNNIKGFYN
jgi:hypothetical protein|tara:strand:- start:10056 stop:13757 length:3702 start_codon:yes stop_codon:yes gene_type:complete